MEGNSPLQGMVVANLSPAVAEELGVPSSLNGVIALEIRGGLAKRFFRKGDIVLEVNGVSDCQRGRSATVPLPPTRTIGNSRSTGAGASCR